MKHTPQYAQSMHKVWIKSSVAMVMTDDLNFFLNYDVIKIAKTMIIFMEIEYIKNRGVTFWPERIGPLFPTLWSGHDFGQNFILTVLAILMTS